MRYLNLILILALFLPITATAQYRDIVIDNSKSFDVVVANGAYQDVVVGSSLAFVNEYSLNFDSIDDFGDIVTLTLDLSGTSDFTVQMWAKIPVGEGDYLMAQSHANPPSYATDWGLAVGGSMFWMRSKTVGLVTDYDDNAWHHFVMSWNKSAETFEGFVDGSSKGTSAVVTGYGGMSSVKVSTRGDGTSSFSGGNADEIAIWTGVALGLSEVVALYNSGNPTDLSSNSGNYVSSSSLLVWLRNGDGTEGGTGAKVYDMSTNSYDCTLNNMDNSDYELDVPSNP